VTFGRILALGREGRAWDAPKLHLQMLRQRPHLDGMAATAETFDSTSLKQTNLLALVAALAP
jgi:hypothetical protein